MGYLRALSAAPPWSTVSIGVHTGNPWRESLYGRLHQEVLVRTAHPRIRKGREGRRAFAGQHPEEDRRREEGAEGRLVIAIVGVQLQVGSRGQSQIPGVPD